MEITFDPDKDEWNRRERGLSLAAGAEIIRNQIVTRIDRRRDYGEERRIAFGYIEGRLHVCVYTVRGDVTRIISVRKANDREVRRYAD